MKLEVLRMEFSVCKAKSLADIDFSGEFCFIGKTDEEISVVCAVENVPPDVLERDDGWKAFRIAGKLDFSMVGVLSKLSSLLAEHFIGIFAVSTYHTDYILTKKENFQAALDILKAAGYEVA